MKYNCVKSTLSTIFRKLGYQVGLHPSNFIIIPVLVTGILFNGFQRMRYIGDPKTMGAPLNAPNIHEEAVSQEIFPMNLSNFDPGRITQDVPYGRVIVEAVKERSVLEEQIFREILNLDAIIHNITIMKGDDKFRYEDICARKNRKCVKNEYFKLKKKHFDRASSPPSVKYPVDGHGLNASLTGAYLGGVTTAETDIITQARSTILMYFLDNSNQEKTERAIMWEEEFVKIITQVHLENITLGIDTSKSLENEVNNVTSTVRLPGIATFLFALAFSMFTCSMVDCVLSKSWLGCVGCLSSVLAMFSAFGLLMYCGVPCTNVSILGFFVMLGIGMDDAYILLAAWRRTDPKDSVPCRMAETFTEAGVSITITSLTNIIAFSIGISTPFYGIRNFCMYTALSVVFTYLYQLFIFGGALAAHGYMEEKNLHAFICIPVVPRSEAKNRNVVYQVFCTGGRGKEHLEDTNLKEEHFPKTFFRDYLGKMLGVMGVKITVFIIYLVYLGVILWWCTKVTAGVKFERLAPYDSYLVKYYKFLDKYYRTYPFRIQVTINGTLDYSDPMVQEEVENLLQKMENSSYIASSEFTESWLRAYADFMKDERIAVFTQGFNINEKYDFLKCLRHIFLKTPMIANIFKQDIVFNSDGSEIVASRFVIQAYNINDTEREKGLLVELRRLAASSPLSVTVYNSGFFIYDHLLLIYQVTISTIGFTAVSMLVIIVIFVPDLVSSLWVSFSVISIEVGVMGFMTMWNVEIDPASMICLVMCVGFSVDYSAHSTYAYVSHHNHLPNERIRHTLDTMGMPILQGGITTFLSVLPLSFVQHYAFTVTFKIMTLVTIFGVFHSLVLLPVLLSLTDFSARNKQKKLPVQTIAIIKVSENGSQ